VFRKCRSSSREKAWRRLRRSSRSLSEIIRRDSIGLQ
jgi:hypothetical protein